MVERLLTPSKLTAWLDCAHFMTLKRRVEDGMLIVDGSPFGSLARLLLDKGLEHEKACLEGFRSSGLEVFEVPERGPGEPFADWVVRIGDPLSQGFDVVYQMPLIHGGMRGIADFLIRVDHPVSGSAYEPVDAKLARAEAKPGHVLQLCFYADALEDLTGSSPANVHLWLGSGHIETIKLREVRPYWNRLRTQVTTLVADATAGHDTRPEPCPHCPFCEFATICEDEWRRADSLVYIAGIRKTEQTTLEDDGVRTVAELAVRTTAVAGLQPERLDRLAAQATLQVEARDTHPDHPPFRLVEPGDDPTWGRGFEGLPAPDDGDVFLDFEGHPFWRTDTGLFFLFGSLTRDVTGGWRYNTWWAHDLDQEAAATRDVIDFLVERRAQFPGMHVYHYNHTERSALERLAADHGVGESRLATLVETGLFVDLLLVVRNSVQVGTESYGLKHVERLTDFIRGDDIHQGSGAVVEYEAFCHSGDQATLDRIAAYNQDDVQATRALRDWLIAHRPADLPWRAAFIEPDEAHPDLDG